MQAADLLKNNKFNQLSLLSQNFLLRLVIKTGRLSVRCSTSEIRDLLKLQYSDDQIAFCISECKELLNNQEDQLQDKFDTFWSAYPRKVAKPAALKIWMKLAPSEELFNQIMERLEAHKNSPQWIKDDGQFIPHPATWLNQRRWEDVIEVKSESAPWKF